MVERTYYSVNVVGGRREGIAVLEREGAVVAEIAEAVPKTFSLCKYTILSHC